MTKKVKKLGGMRMRSDMVGNYNLGFIQSCVNSGILQDNSREAKLEDIMEDVDEINKPNVEEHLEKFSCQEEMERFVEDRELPRLS